MSMFDRIAGYEREKEELRTLVEIFNNREKYEKKGASLPKGIIFYGEAGTGKTLFAEVLANECSLKKISISAADDLAGDGICTQIKDAFREAIAGKEPTMIFLEELDKLLPNDDEEYYSDRAKTILTQLLTLIDGMERTTNVVFVATSNRYASLPDTIVRPGRIDKKIGLGLPDAASRIAILRMYMGASPATFELEAEKIAKLTVGFSGAALKTLVNECLLRSDDDDFVSEKLIRLKVAEIKEENIPKEHSDDYYTVDAVRNAGSFIVARSYCDSEYVLTTENDTVGNAFLDNVIGAVCDEYVHGGDEDDEFDEFDEFDDEYDDECDECGDEDELDDDDDTVGIVDYSRNDYFAALCALMAGRAAEELVLEDVYDNLANNTATADDLLVRMAECGMLGLELSYVGGRYSDIKYPEKYYEKLQDTFTEALCATYESAKSILEKNMPLLTELIAELIEHKTLEKQECEAIISAHGGINI